MHTRGRSIHEATDRAISDLTLLRGLWTLYATRGSWSKHFGMREQRSLAAIHAGPVYTLHLPDGSYAEDAFWYDNDLAGRGKPFEPPHGWKNLDANRRWAQRRMASLPHGHEIADLVERYAVALDQTNLDVAFLQLWSLLEKVTDTIGANYDETIRRATWIFADRDTASEILQAMRLQRNRFVHAARSGGERDQMVYAIKNFVEPHLLRLLGNQFRLDSIEEYARFLSLPNSVESLERTCRRVARAHRLLSTWEKQSARAAAAAAGGTSRN